MGFENACENGSYAAIQVFEEKIGYDEFLREYATTKNMKAADLREVLSEIEEAAKPFQTMEEWFVHVEEYTEALKKKEQQKEQNQEGVRLMTLHASKGLEFSYGVFDRGKRGTNSLSESRERAECRRRAQAVLCGNDPGKRCAENHICRKIKNGKEISSFPGFVEELFEGVLTYSASRSISSNSRESIHSSNLSAAASYSSSSSMFSRFGSPSSVSEKR